jgi:methyl coenzyme M reductase subunit D
MNPETPEIEFKVIRIKAELFDLQAQAAQIRVKMEDRLKELNNLLKEKEVLDGRIR